MSAALDRLAGDGVDVDDSGALPIALPENEDDVRRVLQGASAEGLRVVPIGLGSKLAWCRPEALEGGADVLLSMRRMSAVLDYVPGDGTLTAEAGAVWDELARTVGAGGHQLTPAVARPASATLGGVLGAGASGPDRLRYGPARHHVLGARVMLADGTAAKSGGKLVKNVTGFDLHRLYTGSRGTLCVVLDASLRLFPTPERRLALTLSAGEPSALFACSAALTELPVSPLALTLENAAGDGWRLHLFLAGRAGELDDECERAHGVLGDVETREGDAALAHFEAVRDLEWSEGWAHVRLSGQPSTARAALEALLQSDAAAGGASVIAQPEVATADVFLPRLLDGTTDERIELLGRAAREVAATGARLAPHSLELDLAASLAPRASEEPSLGWMFRLRDELDPGGRFRSPLFPGRS